MAVFICICLFSLHKADFVLYRFWAKLSSSADISAGSTPALNRTIDCTTHLPRFFPWHLPTCLCRCCGGCVNSPRQLKENTMGSHSENLSLSKDVALFARLRILGLYVVSSHVDVQQSTAYMPFWLTARSQCWR